MIMYDYVIWDMYISLQEVFSLVVLESTLQTSFAIAKNQPWWLWFDYNIFKIYLKETTHSLNHNTKLGSRLGHPQTTSFFSFTIRSLLWQWRSPCLRKVSQGLFMQKPCLKHQESQLSILHSLGPKPQLVKKKNSDQILHCFHIAFKMPFLLSCVSPCLTMETHNLLDAQQIATFGTETIRHIVSDLLYP